MSLNPALILAILVGIFHASLFVLIRGTAGGRLLVIVLAAILGAWAGDALADRLDFDVLMIGDFHLLAASLVVVHQMERGSLWSPYYRIQVYPNQLGGYVINVNNSGHQETMPYLDKETFTSAPTIARPDAL